MADKTIGVTADDIKPVADAIIGAVKETVEKVAARIHESYADREEEVVDEALARFGSDGKLSENENGVFGIDAKWHGHQVAQAMNDSWVPVVVGCDPTGKVSEENVKEAFDIFLGLTSIGPDENDKVLQIMQQSLNVSETDPHAISIVRNIKNYIVGSGVTFSCFDQGIEDHLKSYWVRSKMNRRVREAVGRKFISGEHYFFHFIAKNGLVTTRDKTEAFQIPKVVTHSEDAETRIAYGRPKSGTTANELEWFADMDLRESMKNTPEFFKGEKFDFRKLNRRKSPVVQMLKYGPTSNVRGRPQMYSILRYLKYYQDFILDRIILNHERSKVVWIRTLKGNRGQETGRTLHGPRSGQILTETSQVEWKAVSANINAQDVTPDGRLMRMTIGAGVSFPEYVIFMDPSNQVYASLRKQETPLSQNIRPQQQDWVWDLEDTFRFVLRAGVNGGILKPQTELATYTLESARKIQQECFQMIQEKADYESIVAALVDLDKGASLETTKVATELVPVEVSLPDIVQEDPSSKAKIAEILLRSRLASRTTLAAELGYSRAKEDRLAAEEGGWFSPPGGRAAQGIENEAEDSSEEREDSDS